MFLTELKRCSSLPRAEQTQCARAEQRERERERERCVRARWESKTSRGSPSDSQKLGLATFLKGKRLLKGSAMLQSWQHCASPFLQLRVGPWVKPEIRAALIAR